MQQQMTSGVSMTENARSYQTTELLAAFTGSHGETDGIKMKPMKSKVSWITGSIFKSGTN